MADKLTQLKEERAKVWKVQTDINDSIKNEDRGMSEEEKTSWDAADVDFNRLTDEINTEEKRIKQENDRVAEFEKRQETMEKAAKNPTHVDTRNTDPGDTRNFTELDKEDRHYDAMQGYRDYTDGAFATEEYRSAFWNWMSAGATGAPISQVDQETIYRALQADKDVAGGYTVLPEQLVNRLIKKLDNLTFMRQMATVIQVPRAASLGAPDLANDPDDPTWTAEILTGSEDSTMSFEKRELYPHPLARRIKVSKKLLRASMLNMEALVRDRLAYKTTVVQENAFMNGTGSNQPLGLFTASGQGIGTGQDVSTGNTTTALKADNLIECKYNLPAQYRTNASWIFHRSVLKVIRKLKDSEGQYLWQAGLASDRPDSILSVPYNESEYAPSTFTSGLYLGIIGDMRQYWIAEALNMQIQRLMELYAETNQDGFILRSELDGAPVLPEAFTRVTLA